MKNNRDREKVSHCKQVAGRRANNCNCKLKPKLKRRAKMRTCLERQTRLELATFGLGSRCSTIELLSHKKSATILTILRNVLQKERSDTHSLTATSGATRNLLEKITVKLKKNNVLPLRSDRRSSHTEHKASKLF